MNEYDDLYERLKKATVSKNLDNEVESIKAGADDDTRKHLDALLHPENEPPVVQGKKCKCTMDEESECEIACLFGAIKRDSSGKLIISSKCTGCGKCIDACKEKVLTGKKDLIPVIELLSKKEEPVYAMIAPAFSGQFTSEVTSGRLRTAFKCLGFYGMIEVALFADILTLKEALEFDRSIKDNGDFVLTSCCCPIWVAMIKRLYNSLVPHVPPSVSPMVACGRSIKKIHPGAKTVFIGPCIAKKAEAKEADIKDAVDYVLTFEEISELFKAAGVNPAEQPEDYSDQSSRAGRIYARATGVSEAVKETLDRLKPERDITLAFQHADGVVDCRNLLKEISEGKISANFIEGMGCRGGCVGGPKVLIDRQEAKKHVDSYGDEAISRTPADNKHVLDILHRLGFEDLESLLDRDNIFTRKF